MYLLYCDESGTFSDPRQSYFVVAGISVYEHHVWRLAQAVDEIAARFDPECPDQFEIHANAMFAGRSSWRRFPKAHRIQALNDCLLLLKQSTSWVKLYVSIVHKSEALTVSALDVAYQQLVFAFDRQLVWHHQNGNSQRGLLLFDKHPEELHLQQLTQQLRKQGSMVGMLHNLAEVPVFIDSKASRLTQLADVLAYAFFRSLERNDHQFRCLIDQQVRMCYPLIALSA